MSEIKPSFPIWYHQPLKAVYVAAKFLSLVARIPLWTLYYAIFPRPRASWTLKETVIVRIFRVVLSMNAAAGLSPMSTNKTRTVQETELKETSFVWIDPAADSLIKGPAADSAVKSIRIPGYVWPKGSDLQKSEGLVGLFIHGGGYMVGNASEYYPECRIASRIQANSDIKHILSVDYRLVHESSHPGQLIDAISAYAYLVKLGISPSRIVVIGACAGGHLALMLTKYLYDEKVMALPVALMLFSPWIDMEIDWKIYQGLSKNRSNPCPDIDLLSTSVFANIRFLGSNPISLLSSPLLSANLASPGSYKAYPKCFVSVGECDVFRQESEQLVDLLRSDSVEVTLDVQKDAVHDFWGLDGAPSDKARSQLQENAVKWISSLGRGR